MQVLANLARNTLRPGYAWEMVRKVGLRLREKKVDHAEVEAWCRSQAQDLDRWAEGIDAAMWREAREFAAAQRSDPRIRDEDVLALKTGGAYSLLFFMTRLLKPGTIVETGVCAGFSSRAFLVAQKINGGGRLYSSDFPLFRMDNPEQHIGYMVEEELRGNWTLDVRGDSVSLPRFASELSSVELFHYDSDKTAIGRRFAYRTMRPRLAQDALVIFDDIQDNWHFREFSRNKLFRVFEFQGKWVGMIGGPAKLYG